jgi:uncharacterized membrane protein YkvA (DUF1232 family)
MTTILSEACNQYIAEASILIKKSKYRTETLTNDISDNEDEDLHCAGIAWPFPTGSIPTETKTLQKKFNIDNTKGGLFGLLGVAIAQKVDNSLERLIPDLTQEKWNAIVKFLESMLELTPCLANFLNDKDQLKSDRALAGMAITYILLPFDILPEEDGVAGYIDDAIVAMRIAQNMTSPSDDIALIVSKYEKQMLEVIKLIPEWAADAIEQTIKSGIAQNRLGTAFETKNMKASSC